MRTPVVLVAALAVALSSIAADGTFAGAGDDSPIAPTTSGQVRGKVVATPKGNCDVYLGVPFASSPVGDLRFAKPQPSPSWTGVRDATDFGPMCIQDGSNGTSPTTESEDCLYLNVFVPNGTVPQAKYPVMIFIHGGGFVAGSAKQYGVDGICENLASRGVVVVTIQYRLFLYGFLSTGTKEALGNYGIWDQISSLDWVKQNAVNFGGDPTKVTIFGESAGATSVSLLTYTPVAIDLFQQSIAESGYVLSSYPPVLNDASVASTQKLAVDANCTDPDPESILQCLRGLSTAELQKIYNSHKSRKSSVSFMLTIQWSPRVDGELFTQADPQELKTGKPAIIGVNSLEVPAADATIPFADALFNSSLDEYFPGQDVESTVLKQTTRYVYVDSKGDGTNPTFLCQQLAELTSDTTFRAPSVKEACSKQVAGSPMWVYKFDYYSKNVFPPDYPFEKGAPHGHELCYVFLQPLPPGTPPFTCPSKFEGDDRTVADYMGEMWTNFAIRGNPSPSSLEWPRFQNLTYANAMHIRSTLEILPEFYLDIANFWNSLVPSIQQDFETSD